MHPIELYKAIERRRQNHERVELGYHPALDMFCKKTLDRLDETLRVKTFLRAEALFGDGWHWFCGALEWVKVVEMCVKEATEMHEEEIAEIKWFQPHVIELKPEDHTSNIAKKTGLTTKVSSWLKKKYNVKGSWKVFWDGGKPNIAFEDMPSAFAFKMQFWN